MSDTHAPPVMPEAPFFPSRLREPKTGRIVLFASILTMGRHRDNDMVLDDTAISSQHAVIERREDGWFVRDLGSRNGTTLNGRRVKGFRRIRIGDVLRLAGVAVWEVEHLADWPQGTPFLDTAHREGEPTADLRITLQWTGPDRGFVRIERDGIDARFSGLQSVVLLERLARSPGAWVADRDLKSALWGRGADQISRGAFYNLLHGTRRLLQENGAPARVLEKGPGATRLALEPTQVRILPAEEPA